MPKILLFADDIRAQTGVGRICSQIVRGTSDAFDWVQIAVLNHHSDDGKCLNLRCGDARVISYPCSGFEQPELLRYVVTEQQPDLLVIMQDPVRWFWLSKFLSQFPISTPIVYYTVWDNLPDPLPHRSLLKHFQHVACISKLTYGAVRRVLREDSIPTVSYIPHGVDSTVFQPMGERTRGVSKRIDDIFGEARCKIFVNAVHQTRKRIADIIMGFAHFTKKWNVESARLVIHTKAGEAEAADLALLIRIQNLSEKVVLNRGVISEQALNLCYNHADFTVNISSEEGFGLSTIESLMAGTPIIVNVTGGLQDQCGFAVDGKIADEDFYEKNLTLSGFKWRERLSHGDWVVPIWPSVKTLIGGVGAPLLFQEIVDYRTLAKAFFRIHQMPAEQNQDIGAIGRRFAQEHFDANVMVSNFRKLLHEMINGSQVCHI